MLENEVDQYVELKVASMPPLAALRPVFSADDQSGPAKAKKATKKAPAAAPQPSKSSGQPNWHAMAKGISVVPAGPVTSPADYKAVIKAAAPRLSPSDARVSTLSRALRFALAGTQYALARESDDAQPVLVRREDDPPGILPDLSLDDFERGVQ